MFLFDNSSFGDGIIVSFGLLLPESINQELIKISQQIAKTQAVKYKLNNDNNPAYVRLYEAVFPQKNLYKIYPKLEVIIKETLSIKIKWAETEITEDFVILWIEQHERLRLLQEEIVYTINKYREGYYKQKYNNHEHLSDSEKMSLREWGWPWFSEYEPYVVITRAQDKFNVSKINFEWVEHSTYLNKFMIGEKKSAGNFVKTTKIKFKKIPK